MTIYQIPMQGTPWFSFSTDLSKITYHMECRYNTRMDRWILNIADAQGETIINGIPMLVNRSLTGQYPALPLPPGTLYVQDLSGNNAQPGLAAFITDHVFLYADPLS